MGSQEPGEEISSSNRSDKEEENNQLVWSQLDAKDVDFSQDVQEVNWEEFHDAFYKLGGVAYNLNLLKAKRSALSEKVEVLTEEGFESWERVDCLETMKRRLQKKQDALNIANAALRNQSDQLVTTREKLLPSAQALLQSAKALAGAQGRLQEADKLLSGEGGHGRLTQLRKLLDARRRQMVGQVASLYPLATCSHLGPSSNNKQTHQTVANSQLSGNPASGVADIAAVPSTDSAQGDVPSVEETSIAIAGLQLVVPVKTQPGLFNEKNDFETSSTALGYVAHVVSLVASYLDVPLRYPLRLGASRSYIQDPSPAAEPSIVETGAIAVPVGAAKPGVEFPLFSDNQELTRSAYAVFLLNKDLEQILNRLGVDSAGPRHTLPNLNRLINAVTSATLPLS